MARTGRDNGEPVTAFTRLIQAEETWERRDELDAVIDGAAEGLDGRADGRAGAQRAAPGGVGAAAQGGAGGEVAIDEAVGLAKRYASPEAAVLVNGILGRIARSEGWDDERRHVEEMLDEVERLRLTLEAGDLDAERATEVAGASPERRMLWPRSSSGPSSSAPRRPT